MGLAKKKTGKSPPKPQKFQKTKILNSPTTPPIKSGPKKVVPKSMDSPQKPKKPQRGPKNLQLSGQKKKSGQFKKDKKFKKNLPAKSESDDDDVKIELDDEEEEDVLILNEEAKSIEGGKKSKPKKKTLPDKKTSKNKDAVAVCAPKRKLTTTDDNQMDVGEIEPKRKRIRDFKWLTTLDTEMQEESFKRQTDQDNRTIYIYEPIKSMSDDDVKALSSDILFVQRKRHDLIAALFLNEEICQANYKKLSAMKGFKVRLHLNERKPKKYVYDSDVKINSLKLVVLNLPPTTTQAQLKAVWPHSTGIFRDPKRSYRAFVYFYTPEIARKAFDDGKEKMINGSKVTILYAKSVKADAGPSATMMRRNATKRWLGRKKFNEKRNLKKKDTK